VQSKKNVASTSPPSFSPPLQVPPHYSFPGSPVLMSGPVVEGFGRGSKQMGVPTANIDPKPLAGTLKAMHNGVYFGYAGAGGTSTSSFLQSPHACTSVFVCALVLPCSSLMPALILLCALTSLFMWQLPLCNHMHTHTHTYPPGPCIKWSCNTYSDMARWVKVDAPPASGYAPADAGVHKMVMNIGNRPTVNKGDEEPSVEVHALHQYSRDFYGQVCPICNSSTARYAHRSPRCA